MREAVQDPPGTDPFTDVVWASDGGKVARFEHYNEVSGIRFRAHAVRNRLLPEFPGVVNTLLEEDGRYRCWYSVEGPLRDFQTGVVRPMSNVGLHYAESADGEPIFLEFHLRKAQLYAAHFGG